MEIRERQLAALTAVIAQILSQRLPAAAARAVSAENLACKARAGVKHLEPAWGSLPALQRTCPVAWAGLLQRRVQVALNQQTELGAQTELESAPLWRRQSRAGWELLTAQIKTGCAQVNHSFARALSPVQSTPPPKKIPLPPACLGMWVSAAQIQAWAKASTDANPLHLHPGAARRAGLPVGSQAVVAHGLLLAGLSLTLVPPAVGSFVASFPSPLAVEGRGAPIWVNPVTGDLHAAHAMVLRRVQ